MHFRVDFCFRIFMDIGFYAMNIVFYKILFSHTGTLAGWSESQVMVFVASYLVVDALLMTVFSNNLWWLPVLINRGDLDFHLIRPVSPLFFVSLRDFAANSFVNLLMAVGILVYALGTYPGRLSAGDIGLLVLFLFNGAYLLYVLHMLMLIPVFWTQSQRGFDSVLLALGPVVERPDRIFRGWARVLFTVGLPLSLVASFPARLFIEGFDASTFFHVVLITAAFSFLMVGFWKAGLKAYGSASS